MLRQAGSSISQRDVLMRFSILFPAALAVAVSMPAATEELARDSTFPAPWGGVGPGSEGFNNFSFSDISLVGPSDLGVTEDPRTNNLEGVFTLQENGLDEGRVLDPADFELEGEGANQFEIDASGCTGALASGQACQVRVRLRADASEGQHSATLIDRVSGRYATFRAAFIAPPPRGEAVFSVAGTFTFTVPPRVTAITVEIWGGGGGSPINHCYGQRCFCCAGGGGGGGYAASSFAVSPGQNYQVVVGRGGIASETGLSGAIYIGHAMQALNPQNGGTSTFTGPGVAFGATGGQTPNATNTGGSGGAGYGGQINAVGGVGGTALAGSKGIYYAGPGGRAPINNAYDAGMGGHGSLSGGNRPGNPGLVIVRWGQ